MRKLHLALLILALLAFAGMAVNDRVTSHNKVHIQEIQLKSKDSDLLQLQDRFQLLNKQLEEKNLDAKKLQELEQQKKDLQEKLDKALQAKVDKANQVAEEQQKVAQAASLSAKAYAATDDGSAKMFIYMHESGNNPAAVNSIGCRGLGQACPGSKLPCGADYACQDTYFTNYMLQRYGSWEAAKAFWLAHNWW